MWRQRIPRHAVRALTKRRMQDPHISHHHPRLLSSSAVSSSTHGSGDDNQYAFLSELPWQFLRDHDTSKYDPVTQQRNDVPYDSATGKPLAVTMQGSSQPSTSGTVTMQEYTINDDNAQCIIQWSDGLQTTHDLGALEHHYHRWKYDPNDEDRKLWTHLKEDDVRQSSEMTLSFEDLIMDASGDGIKRGVSALYHHGILLVTGTPVDDNGAGIAALGAALGGGSIKLPSNSILSSYQSGGKEIVLAAGTDGPMRTLYGSVWATSSGSQPDGTSVADSAYGSDGLPLHTDFTYQADPPGLQIFTMVQPALQGGESVFGDGLAVAEALRTSHPAHFDLLSQTVRTYHSKDELTGWYLQASSPVIKVDRGRIVSIRHNDLDRLPDLPPDGMVDSCEMNAFYNNLHEAHLAWNSLLAQDKFRLEMKLKPGDTMVVANQVGSMWR